MSSVFFRNDLQQSSQWEASESSAKLSNTLREHLLSKATTVKNAAITALIVSGTKNCCCLLNTAILDITIISMLLYVVNLAPTLTIIYSMYHHTPHRTVLFFDHCCPTLPFCAGHCLG